MMENSDWLIDTLSERAGLTKDKIDSLIKKKLSEFPSLTKDAALRMIATENGVVPVKHLFKIKDIDGEMPHINVSAEIKRKFAPRDIKIKGTQSKVINIVLQDETGTINAVVWDVKKVDEIANGAYEGDSISIANAYSKKNKVTDKLELHVGSSSAIKINKNSSTKSTIATELQRISDVKDDSKLYHIKCLLARLFTNNVFLIKCTICDKRVVEKCDEHGDKALSKIFLISGILDDGLSSIRASFFDKTAKKLLDLSKATELQEKLNDLSFNMYELEITAVPNNFNGSISLNVKDVKPAAYSLP